MSEFDDMFNRVLSDPEQMKKISEIASSLMGSGEKQQASEEKPPEADLLSGLASMPVGDMMNAAKKLLGAGNGGTNEKTALLLAMKPWMSEKRAGKLERAVKLASVMRAALVLFKKTGGGP